MKKLSNYTHAKYCLDSSDLMAGIQEIREAIENRNRDNKKIPYYYYVRISKLKEKLQTITNK